MRIALTGGIACGKTTAAAVFAKHGCATLSTDALAHAVLDSAPVAAQLRTRYGTGVFAPDGTVSRRALGEIVFADGTEKDWLENLVHPEVNRRWQARLAAEPGADWLVEIPLLFEKKLETGFDFTVCVHATQETQLRRMASRGWDAQQAQSRLQAQWPLEEKVRRADFCLFNEGSLLFLEQQILALLSLARRQPIRRL
ncbi:MAG: dephospho-CoA kinase [Puniceicoccales bacterium]|jgi:dephospho-CoA kinase|nr:dephospho-CoA kinase [Puniceicoccales bacterium]